MRNIATGFELNPTWGALTPNQMLCRYFPIDRFFQLLENKSLWFTRVFNWRKEDPCEAVLLPAFRNELKNTHQKNASAVNFMVSDIELGLKSSFGCCFMQDDGHEKYHMWKIYCPEHLNYGVMIRIQAKALENLLQNSPFKFKFLKNTVYLSENEASTLSLHQTRHSSHPTNPSYFNTWESLFVKRKAYEAEKEVRAIVSNGTFRRSYLLWFAESHGIPLSDYAREAMNPENIPADTLRLGIEGEHGKGFLLDLNEKMTSLLIHKIEDDFENTFPTLRDQKGVYIPINLNEISEIIVHPSIWKNKEKMNFLEAKVKSYDLGNILIPSELIKSKWY